MEQNEKPSEKPGEKPKPRFLKLLLLGPAKAGKTTCAVRTAPDGGVFVINSDQEEAISLPVQGARPFDEYPSIVETPQAFERAFQVAKKGVADGKYSTIVWDTVTEYARKLEASLQEQAGDSDKWTAFRLLKTHIMWGGVDRLLKLPAHVIVVAHTAIDDSGKVSVDMNGQCKPRLPAVFHEVWLLDKRNEKRTLTVKRDGVLGSRMLPNVGTIDPASVRAILEQSAPK